MALVKLAIHQIHRNQGIVRHNFSQSVLDTDNATTQELYNQLEQAFDRSRNPTFARFANADSEFPLQLNTYGNGRKVNQDFLTFNHTVLNQLRARIERDGRYKGGFFIFAESDRGGENFVDIFFVRDKKAVNFKWSRDHFDIKDIESFDTDKLVMSCQINISRFGVNNADRCIYFYASDTTERKFFYPWLDATDFESSRDSTEAVKNVLRKFPPRDIETGRLINLETREPLEEDNQFDFIAYDQKILAAFEAQNNNEVNVQDISNRIYHQEDALETHLRAEGKEVPRQFIKHQQTINNMGWVNKTAEEVTLKFRREVYGDTVIVEKRRTDAGVMEITGRVIVEVPDLARKIDQEMSGLEP